MLVIDPCYATANRAKILIEGHDMETNKNFTDCYNCGHPDDGIVWRCPSCGEVYCNEAMELVESQRLMQIFKDDPITMDDVLDMMNWLKANAYIHPKGVVKRG